MVTNIMLALFLLLLLTGIYKYYIHTALPVDEKDSSVNFHSHTVLLVCQSTKPYFETVKLEIR